MLEVIKFEDLQIGDQILIDLDREKLSVHTIKEIDKESYLIVTEQSNPMDIALEDPEEIIRVGTADCKLRAVEIY